MKHPSAPPAPVAVASPRRIPVRGPSGKVWGMLDPHTMVIEFKHGTLTEAIDLTQYRTEPSRS